MKQYLLLTGVLLVATAFKSVADEPTALNLARRGNQYVGVQSRDKVVQIRSEKSISSLTPNIWYVVYYDPDATFKAVEVKFGGGQELEVTHPWRVIEMTGDDHHVLDGAKLKVDSDQAIRIAKSQPVLANVKLDATQLWLEHGDTGPQWRVKLWALRINNNSGDADIGVVILSAADGSIVNIDLHPNSVD
ncbi:MAG TPA: hypothetical protein VNX46_14135 [Candidatus Acidoferrum sp.]|nr:hypothetical protein [Candidatus Acidoferrum sp.]